MDIEQLKIWLNKQIEETEKNEDDPAYHVYSTVLAWLNQNTNIHHILELLDASRRNVGRGLWYDGEWINGAEKTYNRIIEYIVENSPYNIWRLGMAYGGPWLIEEGVLGKTRAIERAAEYMKSRFDFCTVHALSGGGR